jgi:hypothetical protein
MSAPGASSDGLSARAQALGAAHPDIAMVIQFLVADEAPGAAPRIALVMRDGETVPWFAAGKGVEGMTWDRVPGRERLGEIVADPRVAGCRLYLNFCDARAIILVTEDGQERIAGEEIAESPYRILYPEIERVPALAEFFYLWGEPIGGRRPPSLGDGPGELT